MKYLILTISLPFRTDREKILLADMYDFSRLILFHYHLIPYYLRISLCSLIYIFIILNIYSHTIKRSRPICTLAG